MIARCSFLGFVSLNWLKPSTTFAEAPARSGHAQRVIMLAKGDHRHAALWRGKVIVHGKTVGMSRKDVC